jgi:uncharacterized Zn finger protein
MDKETETILMKIEERLTHLETALAARLERLKSVIYAYLEADSSMALSSIKANLKTI